MHSITDIKPIQAKLQQAEASLSHIILGKPQQIRLAISCLLAQGHLLIEDLPGLGKTTLASALARIFDLDFQRVQFTSDILPADITGISIFNPQSQQFDFHSGPVFCQLLLADEINRAPPKSQSALLEAMEEKQVTQDRQSRPLPSPFFVIATQNPSEQAGTYPLPESQLDRFLMRIEMGYPDSQAERELLQGEDRRHKIKSLPAVISPGQLLDYQNTVAKIHISKSLLDYMLGLLHSSRLSPWFACGLSPRAGLALQKCAQAWALLEGRDFVLPEDVQTVFPSVAAHRLIKHSDFLNEPMDDLMQKLLQQVPV